MDSVNLWEISNYDYYNSLNEFLLDNDLISFKVKDVFTKDSEVSSYLEAKYLKENKQLVYTDLKHPICTNGKEIIINSTYYEENKKRIDETTKNTILKSNQNKYIISKELLDNDFFNKLMESKTGCTLIFDKVKLSDYQIERLKDSYIDAYVIDNLRGIIKISSADVIGLYKMDEIKENTKLFFDTNQISDKQILNFKYIQNGSLLNFTYQDKLIKIIHYIKSLNKKLTIKIILNDIKKKEELITSLSDLNDMDILIRYLEKDYTLEEFIKNENEYNKIISQIITSRMTVFEKYRVISEYVKENKESSILFLELINKVGIENISYSAEINNFYNVFESISEKVECHIINLCDSFYNINGYFMFNDDHDLLSLSKISNKDIFIDSPILLISSNDFSDFCDKTNYILNRKLKRNISLEQKKIFMYYNEDDIERKIYNTALTNSYEELYNEIMGILKELDYKKYTKYCDKIFNNEKDYVSFLTEIGNYIALKNKDNIKKENILKADANIYAHQTLEDNVASLYSNLLKI